MKYVLAFAAILGLVSAHPTFHLGTQADKTLSEDFNDFLALVPVEKVATIVMQYVADDKEIQGALDFVRSDEFKELVVQVDAIPEYIDFLNYLQKSGLDVYKYVNKLHEDLGLEKLKVPEIELARAKHSVLKVGEGLRGMVDDIKAILPLDDIESLHYEKLENSPAYADFVAHIRSEEFHVIIDALNQNEVFQKIVREGKGRGLDIDAFLDLLETLFGIKLPPIPPLASRRSKRSLRDDLYDFVALFPNDKMLGILLRYLAEDEGIQNVVLYVESEDFKTLVQAVEEIPEYNNFLNYLDDAGLDVYTYVNMLHDFIGLEPLKPPKVNEAKFSVMGITGGGLPGLIADIEAILPREELRALFDYKLENSEDFKGFITQLQSDEFQVILQALSENREFLELVDRAEAQGLDIEAITKFIGGLFGIHFPDRPGHSISKRDNTLSDDLNDFLNLLPIDDILVIALQYFAEDQETQDAVDYMLSDEFKTLVESVEAVPAFTEFLNFVDDAGIDAYRYVNIFNGFLGIEKLKRSKREVSLHGIQALTGGLCGLVKDIEAILPIDEIKALYNEKLENSKPFAELIAQIKSDEFQTLVDAVVTSDQYKDLVDKAESVGIDVDAIRKFLTDLFGFKWADEPDQFVSEVKKSGGTLTDDLNDFKALLPIDDIFVIVLRYLATDSETKDAIDYIRSDEFKTLVKSVEDVPAFTDFLDFVDDAGIDAYRYVNILNGFLGIEKLRRSKREVSLHGIQAITGGLCGLVKDIEAILPIDEIKALYNEKLENSEPFAALIAKIKSDEFQTLVDAVVTSDQYKDLVDRAESVGIDVDAIRKFLTDLFGFKWADDPK